MRRIAHIQDNIIINVSLAEDDAELAPNTMLESEAIAAGYIYQTSVVVPEPVTRRQLKRWLLAQGLLDQIPALIAQISDPAVKAQAQVDWEDAATFEVTHPLVVSFAALLGMSNEQLHEAWRQAALIQ